jgi:hypothetical protein
MPDRPADLQVFKRPMTDAERRSVDKVYKNAQKQARPAGFMAILFAAISITSGAATLDLTTSKGLTSVLVIVIGLFAFVIAFSTFRVRGTVSNVQNDGHVIVVRGPVSRSDGNIRTSAMMVGPLAIGWRKRTASPLQEGSFAEVACVPQLRSVVSINGAGLDSPIKIMIPTDLEARAAAAPPAYPAQAAGVSYQNVTPPSNAMSFCPSCGTPTSGLAFCSNCGNKF